jgi:prepilin-type N-terminal cleavage/methylation domain-containing protein
MKKGFTLIEAVLAVALLAVLVYLGSVSFLELVPKYRLEKAVWDIRSALNAARYKALFEGASYRLRFAPAAFTLDKFDDGKNAWVMAERHSSEGVTFESNNSPVFTPEGTVTGLATIFIKNGWGTYKITIAITGRIKSARVS